MTQLEKARTKAPGSVIYTGKTRTTGGRENGISRSSDGRLDVTLSLPGSPRIGTNPEQLFAAGWSACFESAIGLAARRRKVALSEIVIEAEEGYARQHRRHHRPEIPPKHLHGDARWRFTQ